VKACRKHLLLTTLVLVAAFFGDGKTAVRGGSGIYYDVGNPGGVFINEADGSYPAILYTFTNPKNALVTFPITPPPLASVLSSNLANTVVTVAYHAGQPYNIQFNLTIRQQLARNTAVSVAYIGSHGVDPWQQLEGNPTIPTSVVNGVQYQSDATSAPGQTGSTSTRTPWHKGRY
jgi:hypothetical protein